MKKMGRPKKAASEAVLTAKMWTLVSPEMLDYLRRRAQYEERSVAELIRQWIVADMTRAQSDGALWTALQSQHLE